MTLKVFISHAPEDHELGSLLAALVARHGYQVWRHEAPLKTAAYRAKTLAALDESQVVIVIWTAVSRASPWVIDEADAGMKKGATVAVEVDGNESPLGFAGSVRVKVRLTANGFSKRAENDICEAILEAADEARLLASPRRFWLDHSLPASLLNLLVDGALLGSLAGLATVAGKPRLLVGTTGVLLVTCLSLGAVAVGYAGDVLSQAAGTRARAYSRRLRWRWVAESLGAGIGATMGVYLLYGLLKTKNPHTTPHWWVDTLEIFLFGGTVVAALLLTFKYVPLFVSRRLRLALLGRPGRT